jgi:Zn-dependent protease with chaperone function
MNTLNRFALAAALASGLAACSSTTAPGAVVVDRRQLLIVPSETVDKMAAVNFQEQNAKAKAAGVLVESGPELDRLRRITERLKRQAPVFRPDAANWNWELALIDQPVVNASCGPGGKITVYTGIMRKLSLSDDELAMVLGHEIAHALREHGRERVSQAAAQNVLTSVAVGALGGGEPQAQVAQQFADVLYGLPNSR